MWKISLSDLRLHADDHAAVLAVLESNWLTMGPKTQAFEQAFAEALDPDHPPHCFAVANCTVGLHMALVAAGVGPGDEVIVPSLTFVASANAVLYTGATVVLADVTSPEDLTLSVDDVVRKCTPRTKAVIPVHYAGQPCDMVRLMEACDKRGITVIEDAAHAPLGDAWAAGGTAALGTIGTLGCFSFFSNKNMATGEGGMVATRSHAVADKLRALRSHGMTTMTLERHRGHAYSYDVTDLGFNYRMDEMRAALGLSQLGRLPAANRRRAEVFALYRAKLAALAVAGLVLPFAERAVQGRIAHHILPILLPPGVARGGVQDSLKAAGIQTSVHYPPIHNFSFHREALQVRAADLAVTDSLAGRLLTLPFYPALDESDVDTVVRALRQALTASVQPAAALGGA